MGNKTDNTAESMAKTWITDDRGNRCSIEYWGSRKAAQAALDSLKYCDDCSGCSRCSRCSDLRSVTNKSGQDVPSAPPPVPAIENIHQRMFEAVSAPGALDMGQWHTCEKTHCRAGWAVTLAGAEGKALEQFYNTELAAMMTYDKSDPDYRINPARFYDENDAALADMKALAERVA